METKCQPLPCCLLPIAVQARRVSRVDSDGSPNMTHRTVLDARENRKPFRHHDVFTRQSTQDQTPPIPVKVHCDTDTTHPILINGFSLGRSSIKSYGARNIAQSAQARGGAARLQVQIESLSMILPAQRPKKEKILTYAFL